MSVPGFRRCHRPDPVICLTRSLSFLALLPLLVLAGCRSAGGDLPTNSPTPPQGPPSDYLLFTQTLPASEPTDLAEIPPTRAVTPTPEMVIQASATLTSTPIPSFPCTPPICTYAGHFWLQPPIAPQDNDRVDTTYRYGSTQEGARSTHHGVEFVNPEGTAVLAAAEGQVIVAGNDYQETYANFPFYYGNLVIIEHHFPGMEDPVFTLYGHLSSVDTQAGASVQAGEQIGAVGYTGIAEWSHLHFEVRVGDNLYKDTRNPELWLQLPQNENGELNGAVAGRIVDEYGMPIYIPNIVIERLDPGEVVLETFYVETYADFTVNGDDAWGENFAISNLEPGNYRVSFVARGLQVIQVAVYPGQLTLVTFEAGDL